MPDSTWSPPATAVDPAYFPVTKRFRFGWVGRGGRARGAPAPARHAAQRGDGLAVHRVRQRQDAHVDRALLRDLPRAGHPAVLHRRGHRGDRLLEHLVRDHALHRPARRRGVPLPQVPRPVRAHAQRVPRDAVRHRAARVGGLPGDTAEVHARALRLRRHRGRVLEHRPAGPDRVRARRRAVGGERRARGQPLRRDPEPSPVVGAVVRARAVARRPTAMAPATCSRCTRSSRSARSSPPATIGSSISPGSLAEVAIAYGVAIAIERALARATRRHASPTRQRTEELVP